MTNRRAQAAAVAATAGGGLLAAAFLQAAVAAAAPGEDAFTINGATFDPINLSGDAGFNPVLPISLAPPLLSLGGGTVSFFGNTLDLSPQTFDVYSGTGSSATALGSIDTNETVTNLLGLPNTEFVVTGVTGDATGLPALGTVYDVLNLGGGFYNVYTATPSVGDTSGTVTDKLVTPFGNIDLSSLFAGVNAADPLQPGDAFAGLEAATGAGGDDAFAIGSTTFDPFSTAEDGTVTEGFNPVSALGGTPPLLNLGGGILLGSVALAPQEFDVYSGVGSGATQVGTIDTGVSATNLLGMANTQFTVLSATPTGADGSGLPATGTVYDVLNLGNGWQNVYTATPDVTADDGTITHGTVTDTLVTPFGNMNLDSLFGGINAANPLHPGDAFTGLLVGDSTMPDAFTLGGFTFDPMMADGTEGFKDAPALLGIAPLLSLASGQIQKYDTIPLNLNIQDFDVYSGSGSSTTDLGTISTATGVTNLLGFTNTEFTIQTVTAADGVDASMLPAVGTVYDVFNLGGGWENIYIATPGDDGTVIDMLVTPFGNVDLSSLFGDINAANPLDAGAAFTGLDDVGSALASSWDPLAFLGF
ncbi:hypothetical protein MTER_04860 [Mycolicibacter terrae]|uniref:PPE family protein n=1 Tax=Mycolicibacter terrae TaxID=1788 RepID=A0AAD1HUT2_9MYCO|nr:hypothetical protein [Mycolicibacter terrae]ORW90702.1 hypothetical protein AWC28_02590 [Mycolicibacter terrae]BBX21075.1 hypothetical protein MTER_04860 [Mycolicibacter terrae]SNV91925.1 Uncharacterised protein [Mycolicibacter terrae]